MADINVERKGVSIWPWIIGLVILALAIWLLAGMFGGEEEIVQDPSQEATAGEVTTQPPAAAPEPVSAAVAIPIAQIVEDPASWVGRTIEGEVHVVETPTDRGFWIEDRGERLFVLLNDAPAEQPVDINPGQRIRIREAAIMNDITSVPGEIDADTRRIVEQQAAFAVVDDCNVEILAAAQ